MTPGFLSSTARSAQLGSTRRLVPCLMPLRAKSLFSSASSVSSATASSIQCRALQIILHRTARYSQYDCNLPGAGPASGKSQHLS